MQSSCELGLQGCHQCLLRTEHLGWGREEVQKLPYENQMRELRTHPEKGN